ncbi:MAG TPA: hypothetical protein VJ976_10245 [Ornithinimicrobium sp.]|nr:hypothetical protein [Ornithinimicrobium sp.]HKJ12751.1 hypothetical protein [Ornithinimicrobium sp.]
MEDSFALGVTMFMIGMVATLITAVTIVIAHRRSERWFAEHEGTDS